MVTIENNKKGWFSLKTRLVFVHFNIVKDGSRNSAPFKMELCATICNDRVYNQWMVVFACCCSNSTIFTDKIKMEWKWSCLEGGIRYNFLFCRHVFTFLWKSQLLSVLLTFFLFWILITKMKTGIIVDFIFPGFINRSNHQHMFWKMLIKCRKNSCERVLF